MPGLRMTNPTDPKRPPPEPPHPASEHRTPREIAKDEAGPIGPAAPRVAAMPATPKKAPSKEDEHIRAAVQRSAHHDSNASEQHADRESAGKPGAKRR